MTLTATIAAATLPVIPVTIAEALRSTGRDPNFAQPGTYNIWTDTDGGADPVHIGGGKTSFEEALADAERVMLEVFGEHRPATYIARIEYVLDAVESAAKEAREAVGLNALADALNDLTEACRDAGRDCEQVLDWHRLPTFGGDEPKDTAGVWSWDRDRLLVRASDGTYYSEPRP